MKVGFIGLGIMGKPMSKNLVKAGHELVVFDFNEAAVKELADMGAVAAKSSADVASQCDVIITMVPNSPHVRAVCLGENGVSDTAKPGTVVIDMSSIDPVESKKIGARTGQKKELSLWMLLYPAESQKQSTELFLLMCGGKKETFDKYYDLLMNMAGSVVYVGDLVPATLQSLLIR